MNNLDPHRVLGIRRNASAATIERAYSKRAKETHPDRGGDRVQFEAVHEAYLLLTGRTSKPDDSVQHACRILDNCLRAVMQQVSKQRGDPKHEDIVKQVDLVLMDGQRQVREHEAYLANLLVVLQETADRVTTNGDENLLAGLARKQITETEQQLAACRLEASRMQKAADLLAAYGYRWEQKPWVPGQPAGMWGFATSTSTAS